MITNIVESSYLFSKNAWSIQALLPQKKLNIQKEYKIFKLGDLISERKESVTLNDNDFDVNYIGLENIEPKTGRLVSFVPKNGNEIKSTCKRYSIGDILYGRLRPNLNKVYFNNAINSGVCTTEILVLVPNSDIINPVYLAELLRTDVINQRILRMIKGAALPRVSMADLNQLELPVPSMDKQRELSLVIEKKRNELEKHIQIAKNIPMDIDQMLTTSFMK
ncbi:hypothetical protein FMM68_12395 [Lachnospiraceae bacterium MD329]|nr:hypothetical protein [Lachnospiraceae bacterium MD329]